MQPPARPRRCHRRPPSVWGRGDRPRSPSGKISGDGLEDSTSSAVVTASIMSSQSRRFRALSSSSEGEEVASTTANPRSWTARSSSTAPGKTSDSSCSSWYRPVRELRIQADRPGPADASPGSGQATLAHDDGCCSSAPIRRCRRRRGPRPACAGSWSRPRSRPRRTERRLGRKRSTGGPAYPHGLPPPRPVLTAVPGRAVRVSSWPADHWPERNLCRRDPLCCPRPRPPGPCPRPSRRLPGRPVHHGRSASGPTRSVPPIWSVCI